MHATRDSSTTRVPKVLVLGLALVAACGVDPSPAPAPGGIDRETFVATYVDLRAAAIRGDSFAITDAQRTGILARHGVTEQELLDFAERNGSNVEFMTTVWNEVEKRLDAQRILPGAGGAEAPSPPPDPAADASPPPRPRAH